MTNKVTVVCSGKSCTNTVERLPWQIAGGKKNFCSVKCQRAMRQKWSKPVGKAARKGDPAIVAAETRAALLACKTARYLKQDGTPHKHTNGRVVTLRREGA